MKEIVIFLIIALFGVDANADDRFLFGLKGPVKSASYSGGISYLMYPEGESALREFTPEGDYIYFKNPGTDQVDITRNEDYVIAKISHWGVEVTLKWKTVRYGDKQYITTFTSDEPDVTVVYYFFYDKGNMFSESIRNEWKDGRSNTYAEAVYKVLEKDKYGNWLKRKAVYNRNIVEIETCKLEYYPENMDENMNVDKSKIEGLQIKAHSEDMLATLVVAEEETAVPEAEDNEIYDKVETEPNFPGGMSAIFTHIAKKNALSSDRGRKWYRR